MSGVRGKSTTPTIKGPSRPPAGKSNSLRGSSGQKVSGPGYAPKTMSNGIRGLKSRPTIKGPVRSKTITTT